MMDTTPDLQSQLLDTFRIEAKEELASLANGLLELEKNTSPEQNKEIVEQIFRQVHSLKGAARSVDMGMVEAICHGLETIFSSIKNNTIETSRNLFDLLQESLNAMGDGQKENLNPSVDLLQRLEKAGMGIEFVGPAQSSAVAPIAPIVLNHGVETVRIPTEKILSVLLQAEEMLSVKLAANQRVLELRRVSNLFIQWEKQWKKMSLGLFPFEGKAHDFIQWNVHLIKTLQASLTHAVKISDQDSRTLGVMVDGLLTGAKQILMFPFSSLLDPIPKIVRDLSVMSGKEVSLEIDGGDIQIDKRILEVLKDPLLHLVRNAIDHGFEKPKDRISLGKTTMGTLKINVVPRDDKVMLTVSDDGGGIPIHALKTTIPGYSAKQKDSFQDQGENAVLQTIFQSGVSSSIEVTTLSGRGIGLAIVKEKVESLGGLVSVETYPQRGTTFSILVPLTIATLRGVLIRVSGRDYIAPTNQVDRVTRISGSELLTIQGRSTINLDGSLISAVYLNEVLEIKNTSPPLGPDDISQVIVLCSGGLKIAFLVDEILGEQEVLQKSLGPMLTRVRNIQGASVLGTGKLVPILNVSDLIKTSLTLHIQLPQLWEEKLNTQDVPKKKRLIVVEDSITTRTLLKNILESSGYEVTTAVDGLDAWGKIKTQPIEGVVTDLNMPRMDGFELTEKIRSDVDLKNLPVVLVSSLSSQEDREKGIKAGANAFIVKSLFNQSDLLDAVRRLL